MSERENILARIREALTVPAPVPGAHETHSHAHASQPAPILPGMATKWLPAVGSSFSDQIELFQANSVDLKTHFQLFDSQTAALQALTELAQLENWKKIGTHRGALTDEAAITLQLPARRTDEPFQNADLESCDVGISECEALIAQTGSVLVTSLSSGGRSLSVLPPHHVVLARREQLLPDLPSAFSLLQTKYAGDYPSFTTFITGPSRTGDIERILVLGAHGPKKLTILCF